MNEPSPIAGVAPDARAFVVGLTRPEPQANETAAHLAAGGYASVRAPLMRMAARDPGPSDGIGTLALTSRSAALALAPHIAFHRLPTVAVGEATAREAERWGFLRVARAGGDVDALSQALVGAAEPVVHMAGLDHTGDLVERLIARGQVAQRRTIYAMEPCTALPAVDTLDAILLYSPRSARILRRAAIGAWLAAPCVVLSRAVADELPGRRVHIARQPTEPALFAALADLRAGIAG